MNNYSDYLHTFRTILEELNFRNEGHAVNQNLEIWVSTSDTPRLPWQKKILQDDDVFIPLNPNASDFPRLFFRAVAHINSNYSWCNDKITPFAIEVWEDVKDKY